ncbi:2-acyl-glycerophospho-ethanolamine acyltransferase [Planctomycetes bacterium Poly30]|uniref:2-acyl-glycerophospho-ethanolamine acyltransferase n=2 Tax=Saltatorellus ferox TaxID=2528018 RepID=A0A518EPC9_9BACT|nr:2-acyl-glycerophospho-ethanolamine acyltransferase [Planctomycetes bacterium Poly30]
MPGDPTKSGSVYRGVVWWGGLLVRTYHRVEIAGEAIPESNPILLVQNHSNGLCDAHILMCTTARPIRILVKYKLISAPAIGWMLRQMEAVPVYRQKDGVDTRQNAKSFEAIDESLRSGSVIALFPEGESLNAIGLRSLRTGVARMAASAELSREGGIGLQIVPVGVTYEERDRLRGLASALIGPPIDVAPILAEHGNEPSRAATQAILGRVAEGMKALILHADTQEEHDTAVALERLLPRSGAPLAIRRQRALAALRADASTRSAERQEAVLQLGRRFADARLSGDDVLADAPSFGATYAPLAVWLPVLLFCLPFWLPLASFAHFISRFPKTPDKVVTLRVLFGYLGLVLTIPLVLAVGAWLGGWVGAAIGLALYWLAAQLFVPALDQWLESRKKRARRVLDRSRDELEGLRSSLRSIREAYAPR